jgi:hypothetical protein
MVTRQVYLVVPVVVVLMEVLVELEPLARVMMEVPVMEVAVPIRIKLVVVAVQVKLVCLEM